MDHQDNKIGFIGGGKMAEAIIGALLSSRKAAAHSIFVSDLSDDRRKVLKRDYGINAYSRNNVIPAQVNVVFLAVKPQQLESVLRETGGSFNSGHLVISIAAGKTLGFLEQLIPEARVVRVMPNLPCVIQCGMSAFCSGQRVNAADQRMVHQLLSSFGHVIEVPEDKMDAVTALSGSGPAFMAALLQYFVNGAIRQGLDNDEALKLAVQTMHGTARLIQEKNLAPDELIQSVTSPGGTTAAGREVLEHSDVGDVIARTMAAAAARSCELSS